MESKIILVTGASDGIGKETAKTLAKQGHTLIIHGRNPKKTKTAFEEIKSESGSNNIDMFLADFLSLADVKRFAEEIKKKYDRLDVLLNNAGAQFTDTRELTAEGHEKTMVINVLSPFLLTTLLLDTLKKSKSARVVTVASAAHAMGGKPDLIDIELENSYTMPRAYGLSKLYIIWVMRHFVLEAKKQGIQNVTFNSTHPGSVKSSLGRDAMKSWKYKIIYTIWGALMSNSMEAGIKGSIMGATSPELEGVSNLYLGPKGKEKANDKYYSPENEQIIWDYCLKATEDYR
ncbi:SDR family NAD(P)-dependent oxidoreductase [Plebeiibacterium marinum]|uniref:SDR family NAD(P)-dependent oxidoreductase n=1 Tax=Plebeiibacterium marinum TaxID=2992111 RepID=A0AAE3SKV5_9BACT|nr:SDR family NAD(P)-dependent oxidoreductase [Plebeiobacterium marinum]MCW3806784.1 SDR family NAD(P)-dependent oxidoreductase [Plebeiobacterium marinum]